MQAKNRIITAFLLTAMMGAPAYAGIVQEQNTFEGADQWRWEPLQSGTAYASFDNNLGLGARTTQSNGWLWVRRGWAALRTAIDVGGWSDRSSCGVSIMMRPVGGGAQVGLQLWDPNGWKLLAETYPWISGDTYAEVSIPYINLSGVSTVYVQAIYGVANAAGKYIRVDDMTIGCRY